MSHCPPPSLIEKVKDEIEGSFPIQSASSQRSEEEVYQNVLAGPIISLRSVAVLCRRGTPEKYRAVFWKLLMGFLPPEVSRWEKLQEAKTKEYCDIVHIVCELDEQGKVVVGGSSSRAVDVDIPRTIPSMHFFNAHEDQSNVPSIQMVFSSTQESLRRIIHTLAGVNRGLGYVQGMNELVGHLLYAFSGGRREAVCDSVESEVFFCFQTMLTYLGDDFCRSLDFDQDTGVMCTIHHFERLFQFIDPILWEHLESHQVKSEFYAFRWITLLFTQEFNVPDVFRVWDFLFSFGEELRSIVLYVAVAMLHYQRHELLQMNILSEFLPLLQLYPPCDVNEFLKIAMKWIERFGFQLVKQLKVSTPEDVVLLQRQHGIIIANEVSWSGSLRGLMSSMRGLTKYLKKE
ncbi:putative GTPase activating protein of Rab-like GTPase [Trypanosoma theileri]|uniref:Putative GTPase activating protein of Rab-like GTPase n=1 Tax=Trypanosoma theileri TaxID=67003 RepID=A0A1X0P1K5_9TRYP|nr:putative GTPase activating protein of Rab-like GTPase [Trypanosoma theileri]ORC90785.1 putative GTPase activating protein of Rab-like GTPase [Trypanosoma theileri]